MCVCVCVPLSKLQSGPGLSIIERGGRAADDHGGPTVPSQRVLQDPGHLTVSVRYIALTEDTGSNPQYNTHHLLTTLSASKCNFRYTVSFEYGIVQSFQVNN